PFAKLLLDLTDGEVDGLDALAVLTVFAVHRHVGAPSLSTEPRGALHLVRSSGEKIAVVQALRPAVRGGPRRLRAPRYGAPRRSEAEAGRSALHQERFLHRLFRRRSRPARSVFAFPDTLLVAR